MHIFLFTWAKMINIKLHVYCVRKWMWLTIIFIKNKVNWKNLMQIVSAVLDTEWYPNDQMLWCADRIWFISLEGTSQSKIHSQKPVNLFGNSKNCCLAKLEKRTLLVCFAKNCNRKKGTLQGQSSCVASVASFIFCWDGKEV